MVNDRGAYLEQSLSLLKEIIHDIILIGDNDATKKIAEKFEAKLVEFSGDEALNEGIKKAKGDWILVLEEDDLIYDKNKLLDLMSSVKYDAFKLPVRKYVAEEIKGYIANDESDKRAKGKGFITSTPIRLFRNKIGLSFSDGTLDKSVKDTFAQVGEAEVLVYDYSNFREQKQEEKQKAFELYKQGIQRITEDRFGDAIAIFTEANELQPNNIEITGQLGLAYIKSGDDEKALKCFTTALNVSPQEAEAFLDKHPFANIFANIGTLMAKQGKYNKAIVAYEKAIKLGHPQKEEIEKRLANVKQIVDDEVKVDRSLSINIK